MYLYDELANDRGYSFVSEDGVSKYSIRVYKLTSPDDDNHNTWLVLAHVDSGHVVDLHDHLSKSKYAGAVLVCIIPKIPTKKFTIPPNVQVVEKWRLCYNPTRHKWVPTHSIASHSDVKRLLHGRDVSKLPKLLQDDPVSIWLGFQVGDIVKVQRKNNIMFRVVV